MRPKYNLYQARGDSMNDADYRVEIDICLNFALSTEHAALGLDAMRDFLDDFCRSQSWWSGRLFIVLPAGDDNMRLSIVSSQLSEGFDPIMLPVKSEVPGNAIGMTDLLKTLARRSSVLSEGQTITPGSHLLQKQTEDNTEVFSSLFLLWGDSAAANVAVNTEIINLHLNYLSDYVFAEGYPLGVSGELLSQQMLIQLQSGEIQLPITRDGVFQAVLPNINSYEIETAVSPIDLRMHRLELLNDVKRNVLLCQRLEQHISRDMSPKQLCECIDQSRELFRTLPAYVAVEIAAKQPQASSYTAYSRINPAHMNDHRILKINDFRRVLGQLCSLVEDPVLSLSIWGEPAAHPELPIMLGEVAKSSARLLIETSGLLWTDEARSALAAFPRNRLDVIVCLDAVEPQLYGQLRGQGFEQAMAFIDWAAAELGPSLHVQIVRMTDTEDHLMQFHKYWKDRNISVIIQKYSHLAGFLPDRKTSDIAPLERHPDMHMRRDLLIDIDGDGYSCLHHQVRQNKDYSFGNIYTDDVAKIWAGGEALYRADARGETADIYSDNDEWYTFNF